MKNGNQSTAPYYVSVMYFITFTIPGIFQYLQ